MPGIKRSLIRLLFVQAGWTYERMGGIGVGHASRPLLESAVPPERRAEAIARSTEFFNSHPWLAGLAVGAEARAERDGASPEQIRRLRAALGGPLGALGDRAIWAGLFPILIGIALAGTMLVGWPVAIGVVVVAVVVRLEMTRWALIRGLQSGMLVAGALKRSILSRFGTALGYGAAVAVGFGAAFFVRVVTRDPRLDAEPRIFLGCTLVFLTIVLRAGARLPAYRAALLFGVFYMLFLALP